LRRGAARDVRAVLPAAAAGRRADRARRAGREARHASAVTVWRPAAQARPRARPRRRPGHPLPRRADAGPRPVRASPGAVDAHDGVAAANRITGWALEHGLDLRGFSVRQPSLEDVYLRLTEEEEVIAR